MDGLFKFVVGLFVVGMIVFGLWYWVSSQASCDQQGGVLVRGAVGYACVEAP